MWKKRIRHLLKERLNGDGTHRLSLREFSKVSRVNPSALSEIISGKRSLSERAALQIIPALNLGDEEEQELLSMVKTLSNFERVLLRQDAQVLISDWCYAAILSLFELHGFRLSQQMIQQELGLTEKKTQECLEHLIRTKLIREEEGLYIYSGYYWTSTDEIPSQTIRRAHYNDLSLAQKALEKVSYRERDFTAITFAGNSETLVKVKREIRKFRDKVSQIMSEGDSDQVFKFNIQLFPLVGQRIEDSTD